MSEWRKMKSLKFLYEVNENGEIRNVKSKKVISGYVEKNGYVRVKFENKCLGGIVRTTVHRMVAEAFIPNPQNLPEVNHIDRNRANNHVSNLEWVTHSDNMKHSYRLGVNAEPLRTHSESERKPVTNGASTFESISAAAKWLHDSRKCKTFQSGIAGVSAVIHGKRNSFCGYSWKCV